MKRLGWMSATLAVLIAPTAALAYDGVVVANVNMRAGPDVGYPPITVLSADTPVTIESCIDGWSWCDVSVGPDRGWVAGTYLQNVYGGEPVYVSDYGARIGIPIVAFSLGAYWDHYYRGRSWYHDRDRWEHRSFSYRAPPHPHFAGGHGPGHDFHDGHGGPVHGGPGHGVNYAHGPGHDNHGNDHGNDHGHAAAHVVHNAPAHVDRAHAPVGHAAPQHAAVHTAPAHAASAQHSAPAAHHDDHHGGDHDHDRH